MAIRAVGYATIAIVVAATAAYAAHRNGQVFGKGPQDPCSLLSASEAELSIGRLVAPPYRTDDGGSAGNPQGEECLYRGTNGQQISVLPSWSGGAMIGGMLQNLPKALGRATANSSAQGLDSLAGMVLQNDAKGPWDKATWIPGGSLLLYKGDAQIRVDVSASTGKKQEALAFGRVIIPRVGHGLDYDGARAASLAPKVRPHPTNACDVLPRSAAESAIGQLDGAPEVSGDKTTCTYRVSTAQGERTYAVEFVWQGGQKNYGMLKNSMATVSGMIGAPSGSALDTMNLPPQARQMLGSLVQMVGSQSNSSATPTRKGAAPGAIAQVGLKTDTTLKGSWDHASLLHGTQLIAVKGDVFVGMTLESADYEKAKSLMSAICARL